MLVPRRHGEWLGDNMPNADVVIDEQGGHLPDPNLVAEGFDWPVPGLACASVPECTLSDGKWLRRGSVSSSRPRVFVVLGEVVEDLMPWSLRAYEHVRCRLERWLVDQ
jgi:hypothetical protein